MTKIRKEKMERFINFQYFAFRFLLLFFFVSVILTSGYQIFTGENFISRLWDLIIFAIINSAIIFAIFMSIVFPRRYSREFEEYYRRPIQEHPEIKKAMKTLIFVLALFFVIISIITLFFVYTIVNLGFVPGEDLELGILLVNLNVLIFFTGLFAYTLLKTRSK